MIIPTNRNDYTAGFADGYRQGKKDAERKKGRWLKGDEMPDYPRIPYKSWLTYCSECRSQSLVEGETDFCPNCGAKMEE